MLLLGMLAASCTPRQPSIEFTKIPLAAEGSPFKLVSIEGKATGAKPGQRIVLYAKSRVWWIQPLANQPFTQIRPDSTWQTSIHPGTAHESTSGVTSPGGESVNISIFVFGSSPIPPSTAIEVIVEKFEFLP